LLDGLTATTVSGGIANLGKAGTNIKVVYDKRYGLAGVRDEVREADG
jgi:hypothetical protein